MTKKHGPSAAQATAAAAAAAAEEPEVKKRQWGHGIRLAEQCFNDGLDPIQCKKELKKAGLKRTDYLCKLIKKFWKMPVTEWKLQNPEEAQKHYDDSDSDDEKLATVNASSSAAAASSSPAAAADTETSDASESSDEEIMYSAAPAAEDVPLPYFARLD